MAIHDKILLDGTIAFKTSVNQASNWFGTSLPRDTVRWDGQAIGKINFSSNSGYFGGQFDANVHELIVVQRAEHTSGKGGLESASNESRFEEIWREPEVRVTSNFEFADDFNSVRFHDLILNSKVADIRGGGTLDDLAGKMIADWSGKWNLKWSNINDVLREWLGDVVRFEGHGWQPLALRGPLYAAGASNSQASVPPALQASTAIVWSDASMMKMRLGPGAASVDVDQSVGRLSSQMKEGMVGQLLQHEPLLDLRTADPLLLFGKGKLLDQWQLTAEDSRTWLKYAAPLIADATSTEGRASAELVGAQIPLWDPIQASARGSLEIHELIVSAGPLAQQLLPLIDQVKAIVRPGGSPIQNKTNWLQLKPQQIPIVVRDGRVYHDHFEMSYKDLAIQTRGSVGLDQTINLVAVIPIADDWIDGDRLLSSLKGRSIEIAIRGTISKPLLDRQAVSRSAQQLIRGAAMSAAQETIGSEVNKFQQKLDNQLKEELEKSRNKANGAIQTQIEEKLQNELRDGMKKLFGGDK